MNQKTLDTITAEMQSWANEQYRILASFYGEGHRIDYLVGLEKNYSGKVDGLNKVLESIAKTEKLQYTPITLDERLR